MFALGGAVTEQMFPAHENSGNIVRIPMLLPWVLDVAVQKSNAMRHHQCVCDATLTGNKRNTHVRYRALRKIHGDLVCSTIRPISFRDSEARLNSAVVKVRRNVYFNPELLRELGCSIWVVGLRITP